MADEFGDRMKRYERIEADRYFVPLLPILVRIDGRCFHNWTSGLQRPYDERLHDCMVETMVTLMHETNAVAGYTQSDEISLILYSSEYKSQVYFDGRITKIVSMLAAVATYEFNRVVPTYLPEKEGCRALFDCRAWQMPSKEEATNAILWRENDCTKNSIQMLCRYYFSHKELHKLGRSDQIEKLHGIGVDWNKYPDWFKRGTYARLVPPPTHTSDGSSIVRTSWDKKSRFSISTLPRLSTVANRVGVLFDGLHPALLEVER